MYPKKNDDTATVIFFCIIMAILINCFLFAGFYFVAEVFFPDMSAFKTAIAFHFMFFCAFLCVCSK